MAKALFKYENEFFRSGFFSAFLKSDLWIIGNTFLERQ